MHSQSIDLEDSQDPLYQGFTLKQQHFQSPRKKINSNDSFTSLPRRQQSSIDCQSDKSILERKYKPAIKKRDSALKSNKRISFHPDLFPEHDPQQQIQQPGLSQRTQIRNEQKNRRKTFAKVGFQNDVWKKKGLKVLYFIARFVLALLFSIKKTKLKKVDRKIFSIIGDDSSEYEFYRARKLVKEKPTILDRLQLIFPRGMHKVINTFSSILGKLVIIIQPDSKFKIVYDVILMLVISITVFFAPLQFAFSIQLDGISILLLETLPAYIYLVEIMVNFNSAYYQKGNIITQRKQIIKHYIKGNLIWDVLLTTLLFSKYQLPSEFALFLIFRVYRMQSIFNQLVIVLNLRDRFSQVLSLAKLIYLLLLVSHLIACFLYFVGEFQLIYMNENESWLTEYEIFDKDWVTKYITSFYWAIITTTTVGYGDINPLTLVEKFSIIIVTLLSSVVFGYMISSIGSIFSQLNEQEEIYLNKMAQINAYVKNRNLSHQLQLKLRMYLEYYLRQSGNEEEIQSLINSISPDLQKEVKIDFYQKYLMNIRFIKECISEETMKKLCMVVRERKVQPEEVLVKQNEVVDKVFIIINGEIQLFVDKGNTDKAHIKYLKSGEVIYEKNYICGFESEYSSKATKRSVVLELGREQMIEILKENEQDYQKFCMVLENLKFNPNYKLIQHNCEICNSNHEMIKCPFIFFQVNQDQLFKKHKKYEQKRQAAFRKHRVFPGFRVCRLDYLDSAITAALENLLVDDNEINDNFLEDVGFPMKNKEMLISNGNEEKKQEDSQSSFSSSSSESTQKQQNNIIQEVDENSSAGEGPVDFNLPAPNFKLMKQVRKYSILNNNVDPNQLQEKRGLNQNRRTSRDIAFFKGNNFSLMTKNSNKFKASYSNKSVSNEENQRKNISDIYKKNTQQRMSVIKQNVDLREQQVVLEEQDNMPVLNMLEQIKIDFIKHNEQTIFTECDEIKNYSYYFSNFNMDRVLLKIQMELLRRKKKLLSSVSDDMNWKKLKEKTFNKQKSKFKSIQSKKFSQSN